ncbi:MAG: RluA family pseudouridine synthase [Bacilli bacterium]|nr:RluA family pseudouridine synthase [Bacilli bacterium]
MQKISDKNNIRIDNYLIDILNISRSKVQSMIKEGKVKINGKTAKNSQKIKENDLVDYEEYSEPVLDVKPIPMKLDIVYEDEDVIVINKPNGLVVHPGSGNTENTLVNGLKYYSKLSNINGEFRPGIVHRIDAYTTGLLMVAKNNKAHEFLAHQLEEKTTHRKYIALVWGVIKEDTGTIDAPIGRDTQDRKKMAVIEGGKKAITHFTVIERFKDATLIEVKLETGRTHQIRVHMNYINHPVVNDPVYGKRKIIDETGQCLHAKELGFINPKTKKYMEFSCELPDCFTNILNQFRSE